MIARVLLAAIAAGLLAGLLMTAVQTWRVVPLIKQAEAYENGAPAGHSHGDAATAHDHAAPADDGAGANALTSRFTGTLLANLVLGAGYALVLAGISLATGRAVTLANGLAWGACSWLAAQFLPSMGLAPELPGFPYIDLAARQTWWIATVVLSGVGLLLISAGRGLPWIVAGLALIALPHAYGAPVADDIASELPAMIASEYAVAALASTLAFWLALGLLLGAAMDRFSTRT